VHRPSTYFVHAQDGGVTWTNATLSGLPDSAPDVEGSFASSSSAAVGATRIVVDVASNISERTVASESEVRTLVSDSGKSSQKRASVGRVVASMVDTDAVSSDANTYSLRQESPDVASSTCYFVSAPDGSTRANLTLRRACGSITAWEAPVVVDPGSSSYSAIRVAPGSDASTVYELWAWDNTTASPNQCLHGGWSSCRGGIRFARVTFPPPP
jgi:hypothetical protein